MSRHPSIPNQDHLPLARVLYDDAAGRWLVLLDDCYEDAVAIGDDGEPTPSVAALAWFATGAIPVSHHYGSAFRIGFAFRNADDATRFLAQFGTRRGPTVDRARLATFEPAMPVSKPVLVAVQTASHRSAAEELIAEYLHWVGAVAKSEYGLTFDLEAMVRSDIDDTAKFYPPTGRFYLVEHAGDFVGVGCLKRLEASVGELQRMYVRPHGRGIGAGRLLLQQLLADARALGYVTVRLESLRALTTAHELYRSAGFTETGPYAANSMDAFQSASTLQKYRDSALFMEMRLDGNGPR
ncbi:MAG: GNAT family N-acetyltransferase [Burkholderiaceae bacterium]